MHAQAIPPLGHDKRYNDNLRVWRFRKCSGDATGWTAPVYARVERLRRLRQRSGVLGHALVFPGYLRWRLGGSEHGVWRWHRIRVSPALL